MRTVLLAGATGLVGSHCLERLMREPSVRRVVVLTRRPFIEDFQSYAEKVEECIVDFERLTEYVECFEVDAVICTLGTTIRKAGSRDHFRRVDHYYPLRIAKLAREQGASTYVLVSAMGANPNSLFFYNRIKGELERDLRSLTIPSLSILRPSLLAGDRAEFRLGEEIAYRLRFLVPQKYKPVHADAVASVLVDEAKREQTGTRVVESREIRERASKSMRRSN